MSAPLLAFLADVYGDDDDPSPASVTVTHFGGRWLWKVTIYADGRCDAMREEAPLLKGERRAADGGTDRAE